MSRLFKVRFWFPLLVLLASSYVACASPEGPSKNTRPGGVQPANLSTAESASSQSKQAWEREWDKTLAEAKKEKMVVVTGGYGVATSRDAFIRAMKDKFGIEADILISQGGPMAAKVTSERRAGIYQNDVYVGGANTLEDPLMRRSFMQPIEPFLTLPDVKDPKTWFGGELPVWGPKREAFFAMLNITGHTSINTSLVKPEEVTSYQDLLKPKFKGKMAIYDPTLGSGGGRSFSVSAYRLAGGADYLRQLAKQDLAITRDIRQLTEWLVHGKYAITVGLSTGPVAVSEGEGYPVTMLPIWKEGGVVGPGAGQVAVYDNNPHPNATKIFVNWLLGREGMLEFSKGTAYASRRMDVPADHLHPSGRPDPRTKYIFETPEVLEENSRLDPLLKEIFTPLPGK